MSTRPIFRYFRGQDYFKKILYVFFILFLLFFIFFNKSTQTKLINFFENVDSQFTIWYPKDWEYIKPDYVTVLFSGKEGTNASYSTINIQSILEKAEGGKFNSIDEIIVSLKAQAAQYVSDLKIDEEGIISFGEAAASIESRGRYLVLSYTLNGEKIKQLQYIFERKDKKAFYGWAYTSTVDAYDKFLPTAKAMFNTWKIY